MSMRSNKTLALLVHHVYAVQQFIRQTLNDMGIYTYEVNLPRDVGHFYRNRFFDILVFEDQNNPIDNKKITSKVLGINPDAIVIMVSKDPAMVEMEGSTIIQAGQLEAELEPTVQDLLAEKRLDKSLVLPT